MASNKASPSTIQHRSEAIPTLTFLDVFDLLPSDDTDPRSGHIVDTSDIAEATHSNATAHDAVLTVMCEHNPQMLRQFLDSNVKKVEFVRTYIGNFWKAADERHGVYEFSCQVEVKRVGTVAMLKYDTFTHDRLQTHIYLDCQLSDDLKKWTYVCGGEYGVTERGVQKLKAISKVFSRCVFKDEKWMAAYAGDNGDVQKIVDFQTDSPSSLANDEDDKTSDHLGDETSNYEGGERSDHEGDVMSDYEEDEMSAEPSD